MSVGRSRVRAGAPSHDRTCTGRMSFQRCDALSLRRAESPPMEVHAVRKGVDLSSFRNCHYLNLRVFGYTEGYRFGLGSKRVSGGRLLLLPPLLRVLLLGATSSVSARVPLSHRSSRS